MHIKLLAESLVYHKYPITVASLIVNNKHLSCDSCVPRAVPGTGRLTGGESEKCDTWSLPLRSVQMSRGNKTYS